MAYARIHGIKRSVSDALAYITNEEKTDAENLVSAYNCDPYMADMDFAITALLAQNTLGNRTNIGGANVLAYHMIQSFAPWDNVTPEKAHEIGKKFADNFLKGKYEYVISTHIDKGHIHNHIIFNATSFYDYKKFYSVPYKTIQQLREQSDLLCVEYGLSVISKNNRSAAFGKGEYHAKQNGTSWKAQLEKALTVAIQHAATYEHFCSILEENDIEIKNAYEYEGKHISFKMPGGERFCRGKTIGESFTRENIQKTIETKEFKRDDNTNHLIQQIEYKSRKRQIAETKELADSLLTIRKNDIQNFSDFDTKILELTERIRTVKTSIKEIDLKNNEYMIVVKYLRICDEYQPIINELHKKPIVTRAKFEKMHKNEITAFHHALKELEKRGLTINVDAEKIVKLVSNQEQTMLGLSDSVNFIEKQLKSITAAKKQIEMIMSEDTQRKPIKQHQKESEQQH